MTLLGAAVYFAIASGTTKNGAPSAVQASTPAQSTRPTAPPTTAAEPAIARWSNPRSWPGRSVPGPRDVAVVSQRILLDRNARVAGVVIKAGGELVFDPRASRTLESSGNVVVRGRLVMRPASGAVQQRLVFTGVNEARFAGGGMDVLARDVGLWVTGAGRLDLEGSPKTGWTRLAGGIDAGATTVTLQAAPKGWRVGDQVSIAPTERPAGNDRGDPAFNNFDERTITAISGASIRLSSPLSHPHPRVKNTWTAEVMNLTRNVRVEGTPSGHAHVFIHSSSRQHLDYVGIRYMGPRKDQDGDGFSDAVLGRYGLHFHMNGDADHGVVVRGVVVRDTPSHAFVAHSSNGITFRDDISYNTTEDAYWWDQNPARTGDLPPNPLSYYETSDTVYDHDIAARIYAIPEFRGFNQAGFNLSSGSNNTITDSVVVGNLGGTSASGFSWPESANSQPNAWNFRDNIAHNNSEDGIFVWQNTDYGPHLTDTFVGYRNGHCGIKHGAYINSYVYRRPVLFENATCGILADAQSGSEIAPTTFDHPTIIGGRNAILDTEHNGDPVSLAVAFRDCTISGQSGAKVEVDTSTDPQKLDFIRCGIEPRDVHVTRALPGDLIRSQRADNTAFQVDHTGTVRSIARFDAQRPWSAPGANKPPAVTVTSPRLETRFDFSGDIDTTFSAGASDPDGRVRRVLFFVEGRLVGSTSTAPYRVSANLRTSMNGVNLVSAVAIDDQGIPSFSRGVKVLINQ